MAEKPVYVTIQAEKLWLKKSEVIEAVQDFCEAHKVNPADCAEFTIAITTPARVRFTLYDRDARGQHYMVAGQPAAFMETRLLGEIPAFVHEFV